MVQFNEQGALGVIACDLDGKILKLARCRIDFISDPSCF